MKKESIIFFRLIRDYLDVFLANQKGASEHTVKSYKHTLNQLLDYLAKLFSIKLSELSFANISVKSIEGFLDNGEKILGWSANTRNQKLAAVKSFLNYSANHDTALTAYYLEIGTIPLKHVQKGPNIDFFSEEELGILLNQPDQTDKKDIRNMTMMVLMYDTGCRIQELLDLRIKDINLDDKCPCVTVTGKGKKTRIVPLMKKTAEHLKNYISIYHPDNQNDDELLFYTIHNGEKTPMSQDNVQKFIDKYCQMAIDKGYKIRSHIYCHMFRHSRAMHLYRNGMALPLVSEWLGHAQINTTREFYANADVEMKRKAINEATSKINPVKCKDYGFDYDNDDELLRRLYGLV